MRRLLFLSSCLFACQIICPAQQSGKTTPPDNAIMVTAHRGDWRNYPENSLRAFISAAKKGVDIVELDLALTKDSVLVIMHDNTINRTTDGKGAPNDFTLEQIKKFRLKNGLGRATNNAIPTLQEVMLVLKGMNVQVNLDKSYPYFKEAYAVLKQTGTLQQAIFKADVTYPELNIKYTGLIDSIKYMPIINLDKPNAKAIINDYLQNMKPYAFELIFQTDTSAVLTDTKFISDKSKVWINSLWPSLNAGHDDDTAVEENDPEKSWGWIINKGAKIIQTDRLTELIAYLRKRKLHL